MLLTFVPPAQNVAVSDDGSALLVLGFKWSKARQTVEKPDAPSIAPARAMTPANRNFERNRRINAQVRAKDPNEDTIEGRSAALEKNVQEARSPKRKNVDGFSYRVKVQNAGSKVIEVVFWEYQFRESSSPPNVARRQFLCGVNIKPAREKELQAFSLAGPGDVISAGSVGDKSARVFEEKAVINRVEYGDGSIWQRKDWNFAEVRSSVARATSTPWGPDVCRAL